MNNKFRVGQRVKEKISGLTGVIVHRAFNSTLRRGDFNGRFHIVELDKGEYLANGKNNCFISVILVHIENLVAI